ncbi:tape measure protein [Acinetobacter radioresistens]|uniref:tape measure protein n=1 Tax=Acinetobacter radioresistens TaxID=40216 RepID=UPI0035CCF69C
MAQEAHLRVVIDSRQALRDARAISAELQSIEKNGDYAAKSMNGASTAVREFAGYMAGIVTVGAAISKMDAYTGVNNQLKLVTNSQVQLTGAMNETFAIAQRSRSSWESVTQVYQKLAMNAEAAGIAQKDIGRLTETISKGIALSGSSSEQAAAAIMQLGQSLGAGKLSGDEFNSVMENGYGVMQLLAKGMDVPIGQLKKLAGEGKLTSEVVTQALLKMSSTADAEFAKTDATIGQSLGMLSNAVTQFVGEAGKGSGAANLLSGSIQALAGNLDLIADTAVVGGVAYLTKTIVGQTIATQSAISTSIARRSTMLGELESVVQATTAEVSRTAAIAQLRNMQLADAQATAARMTGIQRLAYVQNTVIPLEAKATAATAAHTAAVEADTLAQDANSAARSRAAKLFTALGGWTGVLTIGVAGLAAGYMYLKDRTAEANKKLEEQANVAKKAKDELIALKGLEKDSAINDMTAAFERQNKALAESSSTINMQLNAIEQLYKGNKEVVQVVQDARNGTISMSEAIQRFNELRISKEVYESVKANTAEFEKNAKEATNTKVKLKLFGIEVELSGRKAQTAALGVDENSEALDKNKTAADKAAKAQKDYFASLNQEVLSANERLAYMSLGYSKEVIDQINKLQEAKQKVLGDGVTAIVTTEEINQIVRAQKALDAVEDRENAITEAKRKQNKEAEKSAKLAEKQAVIMAGTNEQTKNMLKVYQAFRNAGVDDMKARVLTAQVGREGDFLNKNLFGSHTDAANRKTNSGMISWQGSRSKSLTQYLQGQGVLDKKGNIEQTQEALNAQAKFFIQEIMTEKRYSSSKNALLGDNSSYRELEKVFGKNAIAWDYNGKNIGSDKAAKNLARQDNYYNSLNKILGGDPENALSSIKDLAKYDDEAYKARKDLLDRIEQLQSQYDTEAVARSKARDEEILQATILSQNDLIPKIKERYDAEDKLAKLQQEFDIEGHKWTEERKLQYTYDTNVLRLTAEGKFSEDQKKIFEKALKEQYEQEKAFVVLAREQRIFEAEQFMMGEIERIQKRYQLERDEIMKTANLDVEERRRRLDAATYSQKREEDNLFLQTSLSYNQAIGINTSPDEAMMSRQTAIDNMYQRGFIKQQEYEKQSLASMQQYERDKQNLALSSLDALLAATSSTWSGMTQLVRENAGEQSGAYKAMFLMQQAFALSSATINALMAYNQVLASPWTFDPISKQTAATITLAMGMANVGMIAGQTLAGFSSGGYTGPGGKYDIAGTVHKGEVVFSQEDVARWGGPSNVESLRKSSQREFKQTELVQGGTNVVAMQPKVTINNYSSEKVETSTNSDGELMVTIGKVVKSMVKSETDQRFRQALRQGGELYGLK